MSVVGTVAGLGCGAPAAAMGSAAAAEPVAAELRHAGGRFALAVCVACPQGAALGDGQGLASLEGDTGSKGAAKHKGGGLGAEGVELHL